MKKGFYVNRNYKEVFTSHYKESAIILGTQYEVVMLKIFNNHKRIQFKRYTRKNEERTCQIRANGWRDIYNIDK